MAFTQYRSITVNSGQVPSAQSSFPMLVSGTYTYLKTIGNGGKVNSSSGYDIGFYSDAALTTKLNWETESWDGTTGTVVYWVNVPSITTGTVIYMAYGDASITTDQSNATAVWDSNHKGVYHMRDGTTLSPNDSTSGGLGNGTITGATATAGQIDGAGSFNGTADYIDLGNTGTSYNSANTIEAWVRQTALTVNPKTIVTKGFDGGVVRTDIGLRVGDGASGSGKIQYFEYNGAVRGISASVITISAATWYYVVGTRNGANWILYVNGAQDNTASDATTSTNSAKWAIGADLTVGSGNIEFWNGILDEVRISNIARSADWIATNYNNQFAPASFYAVGSEIPVVPGTGRLIATGRLAATGRLNAGTRLAAGTRLNV